MTVDEGEIVALLGANGAGKTTTLRAVSGMVRRSGEVIVGGKRLRGAGPESVARSGVAHVPEGRGIFSELTVWENLRMGAYMRRGRPDFKTVLDYFPWLDARRNQQAGTLSGGEQQMLALARAFLQRPRLLMLDEPSLGLAPLITREVFRVVGDLNQKEGLAVLVVEQNAAIALVRRASRLRARDRLDRALGRRRRPEGERRDPDRVPRLLMQTFLQTLVSGPRARRDLRLARARARADLQGDRGDQLRAGRDGDVHHLHRLGADGAPRPLLLAGVRRSRS